MQLLSAQNLSVSFGARELFSNVNFKVEDKDHIGLVGVNGAGKTTLFRLIIGQMQPDEGEIARSGELRLGYMEQHLPKDSGATLYQSVLSVFDHLRAMETEMEQVRRALLDAPTEALIARQQYLQERYEDGGGYTYLSRLRSTLLGLGFSEQDFELPLSALSGGQQAKAMLARLLLSQANLLLLDEPTNHLDIKALEWLEDFLSSYRGAFIVISHDRWFLDRVCNRTFQLQNQALTCRNGNYTTFLKLEEEDEEARKRLYFNTQKEIKRIEAIIAQQRTFSQERNYITIASKEKQIERLRAQLPQLKPDPRDISLHFAPPPPGGMEVLRVKGLAKSYPGKMLFRDVDIEINKGERVFLLGDNGCGKTTLLKMILGQIAKDEGMIRLGVNIIPAYFDQLQNSLNMERTMLEEMTESFPRRTQTELRTALGCMLFMGDAVHKRIGDLSGGERARLELLKLMLTGGNFLLLDEPTNHLDAGSREAVEAALLAYQGALLIISHDRYLINKLASRIYVLEEQGVAAYNGDYRYYLEHREEKAATAKQTQVKQVSAAALSWAERKELASRRRKLERQVQLLAAKVEELEQALADIERTIADPAIAADYIKLQELCSQQQTLADEKEAAEMEWLEAAEELESLPGE